MTKRRRNIKNRKMFQKNEQQKILCYNEVAIADINQIGSTLKCILKFLAK